MAWLIGAAAALLIVQIFNKKPQPICTRLRFVPATISLGLLCVPLAIYYWLRLGSESKLHRNLGPDLFRAESPIMEGLIIRGIIILLPFIVASLVSLVVAYISYKDKLKIEVDTRKKLKVLLRESVSLFSSFWLWAIYTLIALPLWIYCHFHLMIVAFPLVIAICYATTSAIWHVIRSPRTPIQRQFWKSAISATQFSLASILISTAILFGVCLTITTISQQRALHQLAPIYHKGTSKYLIPQSILSIY